MCLNNVRAIAPDGHDVAQTKGPNIGSWTIATINPPAGTPVGRDETVTLSLAPEDVTVTALHPCDWVTDAEAARIIGAPSATGTPNGDQPGSVDQSCNYEIGGSLVTSELMLPGSFAVDAASELELVKGDGPGNDVTGLPGNAYCATSNHDGKTASMLIVLLSRGRAYRVFGWSSDESCDTLKQFAQIAVGRIPA